LLSDALTHAAQRVAPAKGECILDVGTGTGWTARNLARFGARVVGIDVSQDLIGHARLLSARFHPSIEFQRADAQDLPFESGEFDAVASTFGVMFAPDHERAARELARVCRKGGRLALTTWPPGFFTNFFAMTGKYSNDPPPEQPPVLWGDPDHVRSLLGEYFELSFEEGTSRSYHPTAEHVSDWYMNGFGPVRELCASLDEAGKKSFYADMVAFHENEGIRTDAGLRMERNYLLTHGVRR
jgi:ubiquinone/menaquinone biosynthesis C-methylase UbiE